MSYRVLPGRSVRYQGQTYAEGELVDLATLQGANVQSLVNRGYVEVVGGDTPITSAIPETRMAKVPESSPTPVPTATPVVVEEAQPQPEVNEAVEESSIQININSASQDELMKLHSIGPKSAMSIIENRPYTSFEEVPEQADLRGTAAGDWEQNKNLVVIGEVE